LIQSKGAAYERSGIYKGRICGFLTLPMDSAKEERGAQFERWPNIDEQGFLSSGRVLFYQEL
jgi:hypothetical protein